jgi:hypothetical protein
MRVHRRRLRLALAVTLAPFSALAAGPANVDARGVAIRGHDPVAYFVDGRLYLNLSRAVQKRWQQDIPGLITRANQNWTSPKSR